MFEMIRNADVEVIGTSNAGNHPIALASINGREHRFDAKSRVSRSLDMMAPDEVAARLEDALDVLRVVVASAQNDDVLPSAGYEELSILEKAQVPAPQVGAGGGGAIRKSSPKRFRRRLRLVPVSSGYTWPSHPDLADATIGHQTVRMRVDDANLVVTPGGAT